MALDCQVRSDALLSYKKPNGAQSHVSGTASKHDDDECGPAHRKEHAKIVGVCDGHSDSNCGWAPPKFFAFFFTPVMIVDCRAHRKQACDRTCPLAEKSARFKNVLLSMPAVGTKKKKKYILFAVRPAVKMNRDWYQAPIEVLVSSNVDKRRIM
jgi:hypothetical protein